MLHNDGDKQNRRYKYSSVLHFLAKIDLHPKLFQTLRLYKRQTFTSDLIAGIIVGIVALPLAIAFAISSGVTPEQGIVTAIIAGLIISVLSGSRVQIGGPTGAFIIIVYGIVSQYGMRGLIIATIMAGVLLVLLGIFKLGTIIKYIPYPIIVGFTSGIAVTIFSTQIGDLFGMNFGGEKVPAEFVEKWIFYFEHISSVNILVLCIGILSVAIIMLYPSFIQSAYNFLQQKREENSHKAWKPLHGIAHWLKVFPGSLIAIIVITLLVFILKSAGIGGLDTIGDRFAISTSMPAAEIPDITWEHIRDLFPIAITIALLGAIESLLSATVADGVINDKHNSNTELIAQGVANIVTPIFGGIPATGAIARTMTNINNGGRTPVAGIVHAIVLFLILILFMPLAQYIPMVCLAGVLVVVSYNMSEWRTFRSLLNNPKSDVAVLIITFLLTVLFDLTVAIQVGIVMACLFFMRRISETTNISHITDEGNHADIFDGEVHLHIPEGVDVYEINGPYFFGIANKFEEQISLLNMKTRVIIIRMRKVPFIDSTGLHNLSHLCKKFMDRGIVVVLSGVLPEVDAVLHKVQLDELLGDENICPHIEAALQRADEILKQQDIDDSEDPWKIESTEVNA